MIRQERRWRMTVLPYPLPVAPAPFASSNGRNKHPPSLLPEAQAQRKNGSSVVGPLQRPRRMPGGPRTFSPLPKYDDEVFKASILRCLLRLYQAFVVSVGFLVIQLYDWITRRSSKKQTGQRLRQAFERLSGLFVKLGQQLSTRVDLLDHEICYELAYLLEQMKPFPVEEAIDLVEQTTGRPLQDDFSAFDPVPVGSASVSCVFHAMLTTGEEVAVKVRRPGIGPLFAADLRIINILLKSLELLAIIRPGFTRALREEITDEIMQELDFRREARYQDLWRVKAKKDRQNFISAPQVYHKLCGKDVIVSEFVTGIWVIDMLAAKESNNQAALDYVASLGISYKTVAKRLVRARHWASHENTFFHADPHPANVVVQRDSKLVFVDFGACSPTSNATRRNYVELFRRQANRDADGMVQIFINMISPLPYLDLEAFSRFVESETWNWLYGYDSKHSQWWERTSAAMWIHLFEATRKFRIPVNARTVRLMRSTILYETIAARLYRKISVEKEYRRYEAEAEKRVIQRFYDRITTIRPGQVLMSVERAVDMTQRLVYRLEKLLDTPNASFYAQINKASFTIANLVRFGLSVVVLTVVGLFLVRVRFYLGGQSGSPKELLRIVAWSPVYWTVLALLLIRTMRVIQFRLFDLDNPEGSPPE